MKKIQLALLLLISILLSGCSLLQGVNDTLNYVNEATAYANDVNVFVEEVPALAEQAVTSEESAQRLETRLEEMKQRIETFNELQAPGIGADLHERVVGLNNQALEGIDVYLANIENGQLDPEVIENTEVFRTLSETTELVNQIQQLSE